MNNKFITQTLSRIFSAWTAKQISDFTAFMQSNFKELNAIDPEFMLTNLDEAIALARKTYGKAVGPGLLREIYKNEALRVLEKRKKENNILVQIDEFGHKLEEQFEDFDKPTSLEKIQTFVIAIKKSLSFTNSESILFDAIEEVAKDEVIALANPEKKWTPSDFWKKVKDKLAASNYEVNEAYFRKLKERVVHKLKDLAQDQKLLLNFTNSEEKEQLETLNALLDLNSITMPVFWSAYRFSTEELEKMIWLKNTFKTNGYSFDQDRFPEVYDEDYDVVKPNVQDSPYDEGYQDISPDYLGVYIYNTNGKRGIFTESQEGKIVLFKDRIERYCSRYGVNENSVRFVVLMHELGHWLSHWAIKENYQWSLGYHLPNKRAHEALAQLIAYWACKGNEDYLATLTKLSPRNSKGEINAKAVYGGYIALAEQPKETVLKKLAELRRFWMLADEKMMDFLLSDDQEVKTWIDTLTLTDPEKPFLELVEEEISNSLIKNDGDFFDEYFLKGSGKGVYKTLGFKELEYKEIICELGIF